MVMTLFSVLISRDPGTTWAVARGPHDTPVPDRGTSTGDWEEDGLRTGPGHEKIPCPSTSGTDPARPVMHGLESKVIPRGAAVPCVVPLPAGQCHQARIGHTARARIVGHEQHDRAARTVPSHPVRVSRPVSTITG